MRRRAYLATVASAVPLATAGCLESATSFVGRPRSQKDLPPPPSDLNDAAAASYAARYCAVSGYNAHLEGESEGDGYYEQLRYSCQGVTLAETSAGFAAFAHCAWTSESSRQLDPRRLDAHGSSGPSAVLVTTESAVRARLEQRERESLDPPYERRGLAAVNFTNEPVTVGVTVDDGTDPGGRSDPVVLDHVYELDPTTGVTHPEVVEEAGSYSIAVDAAGRHRTASWDVSSDPRPSTVLQSWEVGDLALLILVLPDGAIAVHEVPESPGPRESATAE